MSSKEDGIETDGQQQSYQENMLKIVLEFGDSNTEFGATFGLNFADPETLQTIQENFGYLSPDCFLD